MAITEYHRLGGLNNRNLFFHSSGGWKSNIKVLADGFVLKPLSSACRWPSSRCVLTVIFSLYVPDISSSFYKDKIILD